jgi:hypothetical protein
MVPGRKNTNPTHQNPSTAENSTRFNNPSVGQSLLLLVKKASAQSLQLTALTGLIHVTEKDFLAQFTFLTQRLQQQSKLDFWGWYTVTPAWSKHLQVTEKCPGH